MDWSILIQELLRAQRGSRCDRACRTCRDAPSLEAYKDRPLDKVRHPGGTRRTEAALTRVVPDLACLIWHTAFGMPDLAHRVGVLVKGYECK